MDNLFSSKRSAFKSHFKLLDIVKKPFSQRIGRNVELESITKNNKISPISEKLVLVETEAGKFIIILKNVFSSF